MNKRKIVLLSAALCMVAVLAIGGTLAYFTDTDSATNTFTVGGVKIDLIEQESNEDGTELVDYQDGKILMPIVGSAQGEKKPNGQPAAANYVDKVVTVKNTGKSPAYIRAYFAIPSALDDGYETFNAGMNILHFNFGNEDGVSTEGVQWSWMHGNKWNYFETEIDGVAYNVYFADYYKALPAGATTEQFVSGVYLDETVDCEYGENGNKLWFYVKKGTKIYFNDDGLFDKKISIPVMAVACQAAGFDSAAAAVDAAFGKQFNPFGGTATNWQ